MKKILSISFLVFFAFAGAMAQLPQLRTSLKTFPTQISSTSGHTIEVYIHNDGSTTFSGNVTVKMDINLLGATSLGSAGNQTLAPGDSVLFSKSNFNFPQGMVNIGYNDIVVWPTSPNASPDFIGAEIQLVYTPKAAFKIFSRSVEGAENLALSPDREHNLRITTENLGVAANENKVEFFILLEDEVEVKIGEVEQTVNAGDSLALRVLEFEFEDVLEDYWNKSNGPAYFSFFAREKTEDNSLGGPEFQLSPMTNVDPAGESEIKVYPNPADQYLSIEIPGGISGEMTVVNSLGQMVYSGTGQSTVLDLSKFESGIYFVTVNTSEGKVTRKFIRK